MADGGNWKVQLQAVIDTSNVSAQIKGLATEKLKIEADLDLGSFMSQQKSMENAIEEVAAKMKTIFSDLDTSTVNQWATKFVQEFSKSTSQIESQVQQVNKVIESLNTFSSQNTGFENFSEQIGDAEVSVEQLREKLNSMSVSGDITGLDNVKNQIKTLESDFTTFSNQAKQALDSLNSFSMKNAGFGEFKTEINGCEMSVAELKESLSNMQVTGNFAGLETIRSQISSLKTEFQTLQNIEFNINTGSYEAQVSSAVAKTEQWIDANGNAVISTQELQSALLELNAAWNAYDSNKSLDNQNQLIQAQEKLQEELKKTNVAIQEQNATFAKTSQVNSFYRQVTDWADKNSAAMGKFGTQVRSIMNELSSGAQMPISRLNELKTQFAEVGTAAREAGVLGQSFGDKIAGAMSKFSYWTSATMIVMQSIRAIREAITTVYDLDTALIDLQKTTTMNATELEQFYYDANDTAIQMGVTTEEIISQAAAWSRLGYSSKDASTQMAALSSQFASISPGMDTETAQEGLVSTMKAFGIETDDVLDGIMSKINIVGNTAATTNADIIEMLERSSSAMSEANNSLEETIALETAA